VNRNWCFSRRLMRDSYHLWQRGVSPCLTSASSKDMTGIWYLFGCSRSGKHTKSYGKWPFIVDLPIENGDFP